MSLEIYLNNVRIEDPLNLEGLTLSLDNRQGDGVEATAKLSLSTLDLGLGKRQSETDGSRLVNKYLRDGIDGTDVGIFEGMLIRVDVNERGVVETIFNGFLSPKRAEYRCDNVIIPAFERGNLDWLTINAEFSFEFLDWDESEFKKVPYVVSSVPDAVNAFILLLTSSVSIITISDQIQSLKEWLGSLNGVMTFGNVIALILRIIYIAVLIVSVIKLISDAFDLIIQPIKYHAAMLVLDLCKKGAAKLGMQFESPILESFPFNKMALMPQKNAQLVNENDNGILGFIKLEELIVQLRQNEASGYPKITFAELLRDLKLMFYAKIEISDNKIRLVHRRQNLPTPRYIRPVLPDDTFTLNEDELNKTHEIKFSTDVSDRNTLQDYTGTLFLAEADPIRVNNVDALDWGGLKQVLLPYALGKRKNSLTVPENIFLALEKAVDVSLGALSLAINLAIEPVNLIIDVINSIVKALNFIGIRINIEIQPIPRINLNGISRSVRDRIGMLKMETDFNAVPKLIMIEDNEDPRYNTLLEDNSTYLNAGYLWDNFWKWDSAVPRTEIPNANHYKKYITDNIPFCYSDYKLLKEDQTLITEGGTITELISLEYDLYNNTATIEDRENTLISANLVERIKLPNGR